MPTWKLKFMGQIWNCRIVPVLAVCMVAMSQAGAVDLTEGFDNIADLPSKGWSLQNLSSPAGTIDWFQGNDTVFVAEDGPIDSYLGTNFNNTAGAGDISNWAITPTLTYSNGDTFTFYTRTVTDSQYADRLQVRLSTNGASADVGNTAASVGDFTTLLLDINPTLTTSVYPEAWTQYVVTLSGLGGPTSGRIAFRYFVTDGGPSGTNSNYIGIDTLKITTAVPEPSTCLLGAIAAPFIVFGGRRMKRSNPANGR